MPADYTYIFHPNMPDTGSLDFDFRWTFDDLATLSGRNAVYQFGSSGNHDVKLVVSAPPGCADSTVRNLQINAPFVLPNIFTPNGDGRNDYFRIRTDGLSTYRFSVYTRSGVLVFKSESPYVVWDGRSFNGEEMRNGIYYFTINQLDGIGHVQTNGFVHLVR